MSVCTKDSFHFQRQYNATNVCITGIPTLIGIGCDENKSYPTENRLHQTTAAADHNDATAIPKFNRRKLEELELEELCVFVGGGGGSDSKFITSKKLPTRTGIGNAIACAIVKQLCRTDVTACTAGVGCFDNAT